MSKKSTYNQGRKHGQKAGALGGWLHDSLNMATGNFFGSKTQKTYNKGFNQGQKDSRQGNKKHW